MADPTQTAWQQQNAGRTSSPGSPGLSGAIKDAIGAAAQTFGPKAITQRRQAINNATDQIAGSGTPPRSLGDEF